MKMGEHKLMITHRDRLFVNKNVCLSDVHIELVATHDQWLRWFVLNKSFNTMVKHRTYTQVLTDGKINAKSKEYSQVHALKGNNKGVQKYDALRNPVQQLTKCVPQKCVRLKCNEEYCVNSNKSVDNRRSVGYKSNLSGQQCP